MNDLISRQQVIDTIEKHLKWTTIPDYYPGIFEAVRGWLNGLPSVQPETAKRIVGKSRGGMTLWYQCEMCNEPVDAQDNYCRGCGRRLIDEAD